MKSPHHADPRSAPTNYAPSVPMSVYRELASELRANKAVIDSLNSRNQQLLQQNQYLKQEIHNVVQAALSLGQAAGVARQAPPTGAPKGGFPNAIAPDTLARLAQSEAHTTPIDRAYEREPLFEAQPERPNTTHSRISDPPSSQSARQPQTPNTMPEIAQNRVSSTPSAPQNSGQPAPQKAGTQKASQSQKNGQKAGQRASQKPSQKTAKPKAEKAIARRKPVAARQQPAQNPGRRTDSVMTTPPQPKLFTAQSGEYRSSALDTQENKEIGGIWLVLSIILIIVTAFGAGFLIMKPLLNDR